MELSLTVVSGGMSNMHIGECGEVVIEDDKDTVDTGKDKESTAAGVAFYAFYPPVYIQRYLRVSEALTSLLELTDPNVPKTVFEVGCAEMKLHKHLKYLNSVEKLIYLDIDRDVITRSMNTVRPFTGEYLQRRNAPLNVEVYSGSIVKIDTRVLTEPKVWALVAIELVEHLKADVLEGFEKSVFGVLRPSVILVTTPNAEFNSYFKIPPGKFRHWDHKFEWTRLEFHQWCDKICQQYPGYSYSVVGIGQGPEETAGLGCVSQMATFLKSVSIDAVAEAKKCTEIATSEGIIMENAYELKLSIDYPFNVDLRTDPQKIIEEFTYYVNSYLLSRNSINSYLEEGVAQISYPVKDLHTLPRMPASAADINFAMQVLMCANYRIEFSSQGEPVVILAVPESDESDRSDENMGDNENDLNLDKPESSETYNECVDPEENWDL